MERGMGMEWFIILLIWLVAPFAELAAIIVLAVANSRYKRRIWELTRGADKADTGMQDKGLADTEIQHERPADAVTQHEKSAAWYGPGQAIVVPEDFEKGETACQVPDIPHKQTALVRAPKIDGGFFQGTAALVIGVIFVVLAGLIFATTAWHVLPSVGKVIMVLGGQVCFSGQAGQLKKILRLSGQDRPFIFWAACFYFLPYWRLDISGCWVWSLF